MLSRLFLCLVFISSVAMALDSSVECVQSVCGTKPKASWALTAAQYVGAHEAVEKGLKRPISNYIGRVIHQALVRDQSFQAFLAMKEFPQIDSRVSKFITVLSYFKNFSEYMKALSTNERGEYFIDPEKLKQQSPALSQIEIEAVTSVNPYLHNFIRDSSSFNNILPVAIKYKFGKTISMQMAQIQIANEISVIEENLTSSFPMIKSFLVFNPVVKKASRGHSLSEAEQAILSEAYRNALLVKLLLEESVLEKFGRLPLNIEEIRVQAKAVYEKSNLKTVFANRPSIKALYQNVFKQCMSNMTYSYAALPTQVEINHFQNILPSVEQIAQHMLEERKKASLKAIFKPEYQYPMAKENFIPNMSQIFNTKKEDLDSVQKNKINMTTAEGFQWGLLAVVSFTDTEFLKEAAELCKQYLSLPLNDASYTGAGVIRISRTSILNPSLGISIVAHELGHQVQSAFASEVTEELKCLSSIQASEHYVGEDFADLFSAEVVKRFEAQYQTASLENLGCAVAKYNNEIFVTDSLKNNDPKDVHSSGLYRVMAFSAMTKGVTRQCQKVLNEASETRFLNYCRWKY